MMPFIKLQLVFFIAFGVCQFCHSTPEKFPVIYIHGKVKYFNNDGLIQPGDSISKNSKLLFDSDSSFILTVIENHVFKLYQNDFNDKKLNHSEKLSCHQLISETPFLDSMYHQSIFIQKDTLLFYITQHKSFLNKNDFQFKDNNFLIIQFETTGRVYTRKISYSGETILIDKPIHFREDTLLHTKQIKVFQYNSTTNHYKQLYFYLPREVSTREFKKIIEAISVTLHKLYPNQSNLIKSIQYEVVLELIGLCPKTLN